MENLKVKLVTRLIKVGNNEKDAVDMVNEHLEYVERVYPDATIKEKANVIRVIQ